MLESATGHSLVLVDEMGTGTAPEEGAVLAVALLEEFRKRGSLTLATTHHDRLKAYASSTSGIVNAAVEFDEVNLRPTFRLLVGVPGMSSGIEIARRLGLPVGVIERARSQLSPEAREARELIAYLHRSRDEVEEIKRQARHELERLVAERSNLQTEWVERQRKRIAELEKKFADTLKQLEANVAQLTADIADKKTRAQLEKQAGRRISKLGAEARDEANAAVVEQLAASQADLGVTVDAPAPVEPDQLVPGTRVRIRGMKQPVIFRRFIPTKAEGRDDRNAEVEAGPLRMKVALGDVTAIEKEGAATSTTPVPASRGITVHAQPSDEPAADEINVIGCTVEEATRRVEKFLNDAALTNLPRVRIIHGHGTGALRRGLAQYLSSHPLVDKISAEVPEHGGDAITIVELKS
jgi:DNA mismatch repair protein MutS2